MDDAFAACAFFVLKRTFVKAHEGIFFELDAFRAQFTAVGVVVTFAVDFYHISYGFLFTLHTFVFWIGWLWLHVKPYSVSEICR